MLGVFCFAECNPSGTRQRANLPSVVKKTLGIHITLGKNPDLPTIRHSNKLTLGKILSRDRQVRRPSDGVPAVSKCATLPSVFPQHSAK